VLSGFILPEVSGFIKPSRDNNFGLYLVYDSVCLFGRGWDGREPAAPPRGRGRAAALVTSRKLRPLDETVERHRAYIAAASGDDRANASRRLESKPGVSYHSTKRSQPTNIQSSTRPPPSPAYEYTAPPRDRIGRRNSADNSLKCMAIDETRFDNPIDETCFAMQLTKPAPGTSQHGLNVSFVLKKQHPYHSVRGVQSLRLDPSHTILE